MRTRHPYVATSLTHIGDVLQDQDKLEEALTHHQRALTIREEVLVLHHPEIAYPLMGLAEVALAQHDPEAAREHAERIVSIRESGEASPDHLAEARFVLARALWSERTQRTLAQQARDAYAALGPGETQHLAEVQAWLDARPDWMPPAEPFTRALISG